jgi:hypothetical protein
MDDMPALLRVQVSSRPDSDAAELSRLARGLHREILALEVDAVQRVPSTTVPEAAKSGGASLPDLLIVSISNSTALVALFQLFRAWIGRGKHRKVTITIGKNSLEVDEASPEDQAKLIQSWIDLQSDPRSHQ